MKRIAKLLSLSALITVQIIGQYSFAGRLECRDIFAKSSRAAVGIGPDLATYEGAKPLVDGGLQPNPPVDDQCDAEICWAHGEAKLAAQKKYKESGKFIPLAPDHSGFWHFYYQVSDHGSYFTRLANRINNPDVSKRISLQQAVDQAVLVMTLRPKSRTATEVGFSVESGSNMPDALSEASKVGMVPFEMYDRPITTIDQADALTKSLKDLVTVILTTPAPARKAMFGQKDADGVNTPLYNLMTDKLAPVLNVSSANKHLPYRPNDKFIFEGQEYTPLTFMIQQMNFHPEEYPDIQMTAENASLIYEAINASIVEFEIPVLIGFAIYNQAGFESSGVASADLVQTKPIVLAGGHLTEIINSRISQNFFAAVFENSWSEQGRDANGAKPASPAVSGYNGITQGNMAYATQQGEPPDFTFHQSVLADPRFASLLKFVIKN